MNRCAGIIVAAGRGTRMADPHGAPKQFRLLGGRPVYLWSVQAFQEAASIDAIIVVTGEGDVAAVEGTLAESPLGSKPVRVVQGGATRQESVARGLAALDPGDAWVVVHDGARPLVTPDLIERVLAAARETGAATAGLPVTDTVKRVDAQGIVEETHERERLRAIQTPQAFARELLERAHREATIDATDDCALVEALGAPVRVVPGERRNYKITTEEDWQRVILEAGALVPVTGFGFDVHRLARGRRLILGGVEIDSELGLLGHSDADVLTHAVMDAILGGACLGDIGTLFPDTDEAYRGADSILLLERVRAVAERSGARIVHVDAFISAERPRLAPHIPAMREKLARALGLAPEWVSVKAGTGEGSGPVGRGEVIEARAVATLLRPAGPVTAMDLPEAKP